MYLSVQSRSELPILKVRTTYSSEKSVENRSLKVFINVRTMYYSRSKLCISGFSSMSELCMLNVRTMYFGHLILEAGGFLFAFGRSLFSHRRQSTGAAED